jgi:hypothetical protein
MADATVTADPATAADPAASNSPDPELTDAQLWASALAERSYGAATGQMIDQHLSHQESLATALDTSISTLEGCIASLGDQQDGDLPKDIIARRVAARRAQMISEAQPRHDDMLRQSQRDAQAARYLLARIDGSPVRLLASEKIGSEERQRYTTQTMNAGPAELENLSQLAVATGNRVLAACIIQRNDSLKKTDRRFSSQGLANAVCGDEWRATVDKCRQSITRHDHLISRERAFRTGKSDPNLKLRIGVAKMIAGEAQRKADQLNAMGRQMRQGH